MVRGIVMESIEERAREYAKGRKYEVIAYVAYIAGAIGQKDIDIMRVRQFLERESAYNGSMTCIDDLLIEELCKVMEE